MLKKLLLIFLSLILLTGCSSNSNTKEITFSSWGSISEVKILKNIIIDFEKKNPNIKVKFIHIPQNYFQKLHLLFASNTPPDVIFMNNLYLPLYANFLEDLTSYVEKKDFYPQSLAALSYSGEIKGVPRDISNLVFYVNTDLVQIERKDLTFDDIITKTKNLKNEGVFGISFEEDVFFLRPYLSYFGGNITDEGLDTKGLQALEFYKNLRDKYHIAPSKSQVGSLTLAQMFLDKKVAFYLSGRWMYPKISEKAKFNWEIFLFPQGENLQPCDVSGWTLAKQSKQKEAAIKFIQFLSSEENLEYMAQTGLIVPARKKASKFLDNPKERKFLEAIKYSHNMPVHKNYKKIADRINSKGFNMITTN